MLIQAEQILEVLSSVFFMDKNATATMEANREGLFLLMENQGLLIKRQANNRFSPKAMTGGFIVSQLIEQAINTCVEYYKDQDWRRLPSKFDSPAEIIPFATWTTRINQKRKFLSIEEMGDLSFRLDVVDGPTMPSIQCDRLTIPSERSVWNHFKMCAAIASSNDNPIVNMLTTEDGSIQIHASNDHEEYRAEIILVGGEPPSRQAIGVPVALIDEVSYWMETGLHTESHLDIWFDENHVKFGTKANQVLAEVEEYQFQQFDWQESSNAKVNEMTDHDIAELIFSLTEGMSKLEGYIPSHYAPTIELQHLYGKFAVQNSDYKPSMNSVVVGVPELLDFLEFVIYNEHEYEISVEVNPIENHVIFHGKTDTSSGQTIPFNYIILGVICGCKEEAECCLNIPGHSNKQLLTYEKAVCDWTEPCKEDYEGASFVERLPLDTDRRSKAKEIYRQSMKKQECPTMVLRREANQLLQGMETMRLFFETKISQEIDNSAMNDQPHRFDINEYPHLRDSTEDYSRLQDSIDCLKNALAIKTEMFNPAGTKEAIALLEQTIHEAKWTHFRFLNKHHWDDNPHLWQQIF